MSSSPKVKTVRLHHDTWSRLNKHHEESESFDTMVNRILDVYDKYKGKSTKQKSVRGTIKELDALQDDLVDAVNGLRKTYESDYGWKRDYPITTFGEALNFDWTKALSMEKSNPTLAKLRLKWIEQIIDIIFQIEKLTKIAEEETLQDIFK